MDQNRPENNSNQQQNVHLHMHHVCNCQGSIYQTYYPAVGYRTTVPPLVSYPPPQAVARPYLQHYQYTQFNVGGQYTMPISHVAASNGSMYGINPTSSSAVDLVYNGTTLKERRDIREEGSGDVERANEPPEGYDYGQITPPANELLVTENNEATTPENFVKFLERSCLTAEQIAYRNRNRPCFRNIQNLCIRTRSEILKPCTTISNIHSQGIPWATKDFIYAFVRLTNCWHILKGYWENRDGSSLGKIEKELTPEFRACYVRWEKETMDLAAQLTRVFYNLDTNLNTSSAAAVYTANNLIPPQVNLLKASSSESNLKKTSEAETTTTCTLNNATSKSVRGILHLPTTSQTETVEQGNQTDFCQKEEEYDSEEERRVYMKPGSYSVPKKGSNSEAGTTTSPRAIEFLETAQNINKARDVVNERYWANVHVGNSKKSAEKDDEKSSEAVDFELNLSSHLNVHEWLISSNFSEFGEGGGNGSPPSQQAQHEQLRPFYVEASYEQLEDKQAASAAVTVLQRGGKQLPQPKGSVNGRIEITTRTYRKRQELPRIGAIGPRRNPNVFEIKGTGISETSAGILEALVLELKEFNAMFEGENIDLDTILHKIKNSEYMFIGEVVRDLKYVIKRMEKLEDTDWFSQKLDYYLTENFPGYDFSEISGDLAEPVGPLKLKVCMFSSEADKYI